MILIKKKSRKGVGRYKLNWKLRKMGNWLMSPKSEHYFEQPKILVSK